MTTHNIAVFVGSLRKASLNLRLAQALEKLLPSHLKFHYADLDLPLYNQDLESELPASVARVKQLIKDADGVLFVSPEHNRSIPAALKNAIDWGTRPPGQNVWIGKPAGVIGTSPGSTGTAMAQQHLRNVLAAEGINVLTTPEVFLQMKEGLIDEHYQITNEDTRKFLQAWVDRYVSWVERFAS
ncbi:NADPH-dependent FMN reductase [Bordetella avium]|uniref:Chromate reductase n=1 Tax=Bordetella avium (strain 197N) TaxID=360910 RepID=Q2KWZ7_BORA1|nr:NADPH-dependent FMN reductase [Bordetella avium]AZY49939.1 NAD(P)H-dependent oxidoreductase [Bordetella avium]RIQ13101.1 NAD(P)H-dependent oxidoreductase [Bordetella avium]RIQ17295.1 NAD(P)H-dependent oxidoreductase [Bordetella avium]RIQ33780.1 NAD(P)H-dependent oxidoreductase [Bordetella avium]RIQ37667.1 NAD(P)H-dependent oxidoreductase [Bordetella avium]